MISNGRLLSVPSVVVVVVVVGCTRSLHWPLLTIHFRCFSSFSSSSSSSSDPRFRFKGTAGRCRCCWAGVAASGNRNGSVMYGSPSTVTSASASMRIFGRSSLSGVWPGLAACLLGPPPAIIISPRGALVGRFSLFATTCTRLATRALARPRNSARIISRSSTVLWPSISTISSYAASSTKGRE